MGRNSTAVLETIRCSLLKEVSKLSNNANWQRTRGEGVSPRHTKRVRCSQFIEVQIEIPLIPGRELGFIDSLKIDHHSRARLIIIHAPPPAACFDSCEPGFFERKAWTTRTYSAPRAATIPKVFHEPTRRDHTQTRHGAAHSSASTTCRHVVGISTNISSSLPRQSLQQPRSLLRARCARLPAASARTAALEG